MDNAATAATIFTPVASPATQDPAWTEAITGIRQLLEESKRQIEYMRSKSSPPSTVVLSSGTQDGISNQGVIVCDPPENAVRKIPSSTAWAAAVRAMVPAIRGMPLATGAAPSTGAAPCSGIRRAGGVGSSASVSSATAASAASTSIPTPADAHADPLASAEIPSAVCVEAEPDAADRRDVKQAAVTPRERRDPREGAAMATQGGGKITPCRSKAASQAPRPAKPSRPASAGTRRPAASTAPTHSRRVSSAGPRSFRDTCTNGTHGAYKTSAPRNSRREQPARSPAKAVVPSAPSRFSSVATTQEPSENHINSLQGSVNVDAHNVECNDSRPNELTQEPPMTLQMQRRSCSAIVVGGTANGGAGSMMSTRSGSSSGGIACNGNSACFANTNQVPVPATAFPSSVLPGPAMSKQPHWPSTAACQATVCKLWPVEVAETDKAIPMGQLPHAVQSLSPRKNIDASAMRVVPISTKFRDVPIEMPAVASTSQPRRVQHGAEEQSEISHLLDALSNGAANSSNNFSETPIGSVSIDPYLVGKFQRILENQRDHQTRMEAAEAKITQLERRNAELTVENLRLKYKAAALRPVVTNLGTIQTTLSVFPPTSRIIPHTTTSSTPVLVKCNQVLI